MSHGTGIARAGDSFQADLFRASASVCSFAIKFDEGLDDVIVVDNVPQITQDRQQRLFETIVKRFKSHAGIDVPIEGMHIPYGEDGNSKG